MGLPDTVVFDLDGTMSDCSWRRHLVQGKHRDYEAFHCGIALDPLNEWCRELAVSMSVGGYRVVLVSARPRKRTAATVQWLKAHDVAYDDLFLLRGDDKTPDQQLKRQWLLKYGKRRVLFVVDDRPKVVRMWREEGVVCLHCADWREEQ